MSRTITAGMQTALAAATVRVCYLVELEFSSATLRLTSNTQNISWNAQTWLGNGILGQVGNVSEVAEIQATGFEVVLGGIDSATLALVLADSNQMLDGIVYLALLDSAEAVIADPFIIAKGKFDTAFVVEAGEGSTIELKYESDLLRRERANEFRYTDQLQQEIFAGDIGFQYTAKIEDWTGFWGKAARISRNKKRKERNA